MRCVRRDRLSLLRCLLLYSRVDGQGVGSESDVQRLVDRRTDLKPSEHLQTLWL
jgi:hypothetical protein